MGLKTYIKKIPGSIVLFELLLSFFSFFKSLNNAAIFLKQYYSFKSQTKKNRFPISWSFKSAITFEGTEMTEFDRHYIYHTSWAARCLAETKPQKHIDISSSLSFSGLCSAFIDIDFYDFRPADLLLSNLKCDSADLTICILKAIQSVLYHVCIL